MSELKIEWEAATRAASELAAATAGADDLTDYLALRARNDLARATACDWLHKTFTDFTAEANRVGAQITQERADAHTFVYGQTTLQGTRLILRRGVRALTLETGWPRAPRDGFIRGGGLAHARLSHFGNAQANADLILIKLADAAPHWFVIGKSDNLLNEFLESHARAQMGIFLGVGR